ncbi:hypothetical protein GIB67_009444 [Kingdonia uniflora]|uniref:Bidirectional sugar transporter SWEET n=1 Tax=Kingdonia uniflora TaxID=39325 RepID=A0A7J7N338_9MAGN|nr:hypothetical protein GIB67_009444 [Kingdonia uniflora]
MIEILAGEFTNYNVYRYLTKVGSIISVMVYLAPIPTFYRVYKKKSTEGFQSVPYVVALFCAMLWIYYAFVKSNAPLLISINSFGCVIETVYIAMFMTYASRPARMVTAKLIIFLNIGVFGLIIVLTLLLTKGRYRIHVLGWVCVAFSTSVFAAPLSIVREVIRTKSVEFMPFFLSFFLTLSAIMWFCYGLLLKDIYIAMVVYAIYKNYKKDIELPEHIVDVTKLSNLVSSEVHPIPTQPKHDKDQKTEQTEKKVPNDDQTSECEV